MPRRKGSAPDTADDDWLDGLIEAKPPPKPKMTVEEKLAKARAVKAEKAKLKPPKPPPEPKPPRDNDAICAKAREVKAEKQNAKVEALTADAAWRVRSPYDSPPATVEEARRRAQEYLDQLAPGNPPLSSAIWKYVGFKAGKVDHVRRKDGEGELARRRACTESGEPYIPPPDSWHELADEVLGDLEAYHEHMLPLSPRPTPHLFWLKARADWREVQQVESKVDQRTVVKKEPPDLVLLTARLKALYEEKVLERGGKVPRLPVTIDAATEEVTETPDDRDWL